MPRAEYGPGESRKANGTNIQQWPWLNNTAQKWTFKSTGDGYYKIKNVNSGKLLAVSGSSTTAGAQLVQTTDANAASQLWQAVNVD